MANETTPESKPKKRRRKLSLRQMAAAGDVEGLVEALAQSALTTNDLILAFQYLFRGLRVAAKQNRPAFADVVYRQMTTVTSFVVLRLQQQLMQLAGRSVIDRPTEWLEAATKYTQFLMVCQSHLGKLLHAHAETTAAWESAVQSHYKNDERRRLIPSALPPDYNRPMSVQSHAAATQPRVNGTSAQDDFFASIPPGSMTAHVP